MNFYFCFSPTNNAVASLAGGAIAPKLLREKVTVGKNNKGNGKIPGKPSTHFSNPNVGLVMLHYFCFDYGLGSGQ